MQTRKHAIETIRLGSARPSLQGLILLAALGLASNAHAAIRYSITDLGTLGGNLSAAYGINNAGQVVGGATTAGGGNHAFVTVNGVMTDLGTLGGDYSSATGINNAGQVVGISTIATDSGETHAFVTVNGVMTDLGTLGEFSFADGINDAGQVVGHSYVPTSNSPTPFLNMRAFVTVDGVRTDLGTLGADKDDIEAYGINNAGQVVGHSKTGHPFVTIDGVMTDLYSLLDPADAALWRSIRAYAINDAGQIAGQGWISDKEHMSLPYHAVLLTPVVVPLPAPIWLMGSALLGFVGLNRGKDSALARG